MARDAYGEPATRTHTALPMTWSVGEALDRVREAYANADDREARYIEALMQGVSLAVTPEESRQGVLDLFMEHELRSFNQN